MCRILRNDNEELVGVLAPNGAPSNLFRSITEHVTDLNEAVKMYKSINTVSKDNVFVLDNELLLAQFSNSRLEKTTEGLETFFNSALDNNEEIKWEYLDDKFTSTPKADSQPWVDSDVIDKLLDNGYLNCE